MTRGAMGADICYCKNLGEGEIINKKKKGSDLFSCSCEEEDSFIGHL